jgi:MFS transporter, FHS family, glucose/mannose:H+ symporter
MSSKHRRTTLLASCLTFLTFGFISAAFGPLLPELAARTGAGLALVGSVFTASFLGGLGSSLAGGPLSDRIGQRHVLLGAVTLYAFGVAGIIVSQSLPALLAATLLSGFGTGAIDVCTNVLIARTFEDRSVSALSLLNVFFGVGAVLGPAAAGLSLSLWSSAYPTLWVGFGLLLLCLPAFYLSGSPKPAGGQALPRETALGVYRSPLLWMLGAMLLVYVGIETAVGGWTPIYLSRTTALTLETAALVTSGFWLALTAGRLLSIGLGTRLRPHSVLVLSLAGCLVAGPLLPLSTGKALPSVLAVLLLGLSFGAIFPTVFATITTAFPKGPGTAGSIGTAMGSVGGLSMPPLMGVLLVSYSPRASMVFVAVGVVVMTVLYGLSRLLPLHGQLAGAGASEP